MFTLSDIFNMKKLQNWSDSDIVSALSSGGPQKEIAVDYMMKLYINFVPKMINKVGLSRELILDSFTDAIVDITRQVEEGKFKGDSKLSSYFYKIFYYKSIDLSKKEKTNHIEYQESTSVLTDNATLVTADMETKEELGKLNAYLDLIGEPCKQILIDWGFWGYNMTEIAQRTGLASSVQAKDRKYQCLKKLRKMMNR